MSATALTTELAVQHAVNGALHKTTGNLRGPLLAAAIASVCQQDGSVKLVVCADTADVLRLQAQLLALLPELKTYVFPDYETLPYDALSPHQDIISARLSVLAAAPFLKSGVILTSVPVLMNRLPPVDFVGGNSLQLKQGDVRDIMAMRETLVRSGYLQTEQVLSHGEFAVRGSIVDLFPMGSQEAYRIDFFDEEVDTISILDVETQRSVKKVQAINLLPAHEFPLNEKGVSAFRSNYRDAFPGVNLKQHVIYQAISKGAVPAGIEYYLPLFFGKSAVLFDYLPDNLTVICAGDVKKSVQEMSIQIAQRAASFLGNADHPPLPAQQVFMTPEEIHTAIKKRNAITLLREELAASDLTGSQGKYSKNFACTKVPDIAFRPQDKEKGALFTDFVTEFVEAGGRVLLSAASEGRRQALREILPQAVVNKCGLKAASSVEDFLQSKEPLMLSITPFDEGVILDKPKIAFLTETEILGFQAVKQRRSSRRNAISQDAMIRNLAQLTEGQVVVHLDHGIGRYRGLKVMTIGGIKGEYLSIEYADGDMLNIPITALNKVARYAGADNPVLSKLGSPAWSKKKQKAAEKVRDVAAELLDLYARRESREGFNFEVNQSALEAFTAGFGYEETPDQLAAINATLQDMAAGRPMDRLVCGDVGFGKTEVALRAAFVAADNGKQTAVLVPTTILAEQHYQNFRERFAGTPITVELLSRFKSVKEQNEVIKQLAAGTIDIVIGTHKLLSRGVKFKNLGLVIVDEEHRFGVRQKERLKQLRAEVDLLTLTATPIPRTLNMAMEGMRELSIIATAPEHRLAVKTFVHQNSDEICREAIMRELRRGGQVYYLHNEVATIEQRAEQLQKLVPEAKIEIGHGQMQERELQKVMRDFYHQRFNVLLCSTIIENGLDIPSANTVIIDRADKLGLAQLHQIRGRVGRSHHQAYAYLFTPPKSQMTADARRRLDAIASLEDLGAGFFLATHDLEIRGAGELLGEEQSGQIASVGFSLYTEMLEQAVRSMKEGKEPSLSDLTADDCDIDLHLSALLPDTYVGDINTRLSLYKRLAACRTDEEFLDLQTELIDRFGLLPPAAKNLFALSRLKRTASLLGIRRIAGDGSGGFMEFAQDTRVDPKFLLGITQQCKHNEYQITGPDTLRYRLQETEAMPRLEIVRRILNAFLAHSSVKEEQ